MPDVQVTQDPRVVLAIVGVIGLVAVVGVIAAFRLRLPHFSAPEAPDAPVVVDEQTPPGPTYPRIDMPDVQVTHDPRVVLAIVGVIGLVAVVGVIAAFRLRVPHVPTPEQPLPPEALPTPQVAPLVERPLVGPRAEPPPAVAWSTGPPPHPD